MNEDLKTKLQEKRRALIQALRLKVTETKSFDHILIEHINDSHDGKPTTTNLSECYTALEQLLSERRQLHTDIHLIDRVLNGEIEFDGTTDRFFEFQLEMAARKTEIENLKVSKIQSKIKAQQQGRLLELLKQ